MIAMQYSVTLPADYDMEIVARRIRDRGPLMNGFPGLGFKAFLMARKSGGACPSGANLYAPFYVWQRAEGMADFLSGPGFAALSGDFGRPSVTTWTPWHVKLSEEIARARFAQRVVRPIGPEADLGALQQDEGRWAEDAMADGAVAAVSAFDPSVWALVRFDLWPRPIETPASGAQLYEVGHVAQG
ncbi:MAG: DUF4865 family protein [Limimaricola sp.]|uniref:DUF4865 family protein n=1 Tax=Limimaricola sp. TaxID=2211665 RepID=UPI001D336D9C|nr:DUF4865 family protein [Limimaricola sp.]MBI1417493.1 DUF4865 family protein [Limimaricola sp.]